MINGQTGPLSLRRQNVALFFGAARHAAHGSAIQKEFDMRSMELFKPSVRPCAAAAGLKRLAGLSLLSIALVGTAHAEVGFRKAMTWTVLAQQDGYVRVGADTASNAYLGDTPINAELPILCVNIDGRPAPETLSFYYSGGWLRGEVKLTPAIHGAVLTSHQMGDEICANTFGAAWQLAEFHDGRYGSNFEARGGWTFWAEGQLPSGQRFWTAIEDQPANAWNSQGDVPAIQVPKFLPSEAAVPDQYVVMFSEDTPSADVDPLAQSLVSLHGGTIINLFPSVQGFSFNGSESQARSMSADARVESVEQDTYGEPAEVWARDRIDQRTSSLDYKPYTPSNNGSGVNIYVLDSGFRRSHEQFGGRATQQMDFIRFMGSRDDCNGHGTAVASVAGGNTLGVAPGANLISIRIAGCGGVAYNPLNSVTTSTIVAGLDWVTRTHIKPAVVNVSYGSPPGFWRRWFKWRTPQDRAVRRAVEAGITVVVAAGNENKDAERSTPARAREAITVSATDRYDSRASFGNYGKVDLFAPGVDVTVAGLNSDSEYSYLNGTSFSAPMVAGAAAIYLHDHPWASPDEVRAALQNSATHGVVGNPGSGSSNRLLFVPSLDTGTTRKAFTWSVGVQRGNLNRVGVHGDSNPYVGDTPVFAILPVLCIITTGDAAPSGLSLDSSGGWARGTVGATQPVSGTLLTSRATADELCASTFGTGWRMAEFHDGRWGPGLQYTSGWSFWAYGLIPLGTRLWVAIDDQLANPWN